VTVVIAGLMVALVINLTWIQVINARSLTNNVANTRNLAAEARSDRGAILTRDGVVLAQSEPLGNGTYQRVYPKNSFAAHTVGYFSPRYGRAGIEAAENDVLTGGERTFATWGDAFDAAVGRSVPGNDVLLTIDSGVQAAAIKALDGRKGAAVVLDPRSGAVLAMAANPGYNPNDIDSDWAKLQAPGSGAPLIDRARSALFAPGSTFKVVTLTGALANGVATPETVLPGPGSLDIGNAPVTNFEGGSYDQIDVTSATMKSVNTVFAQLAVKMGAPALVKQADQFGFDTKVPYELPAKISLMPNPAEMTVWETAWAGVGQPVGEHESPPGPQSTVLQMALVASGIANDGIVMAPFVVGSVRDQAGRNLAGARPKAFTTATDPATAEQVTQIMQKVVTGGSGGRAQIDGVKVAGKTGTAEVGKGLPTNAWFIAFAPADNPTVALAIMIEGGGIGGQVAAPAARPVLEAALKAQKAK
jgi:cell division protein FtsI/penicillin-binding protein 2